MTESAKCHCKVKKDNNTKESIHSGSLETISGIGKKRCRDAVAAEARVLKTEKLTAAGIRPLPAQGQVKFL